jgi:hypothetical protein
MFKGRAGRLELVGTVDSTTETDAELPTPQSEELPPAVKRSRGRPRTKKPAADADTATPPAKPAPSPAPPATVTDTPKPAFGRFR